jgi:hypothetical protein
MVEGERGMRKRILVKSKNEEKNEIEMKAYFPRFIAKFPLSTHRRCWP